MKSHSALVQAPDGISEQARLKLVSDFKNSGYTVRNYLSSLDTHQVHTVSTIGGVTGKWRVLRVSPATDSYGWVEVAATAYQGEDKQTVVRRVSFGQSQIFKLAMLSETTNCIYCHLRVHGDVGSLEYMRPGWGTEGRSGIGSGGHEGGSVIHGSVYAARDITHDDTNLSGSPKTINGAKVTGDVTTFIRAICFRVTPTVMVWPTSPPSTVKSRAKTPRAACMADSSMGSRLVEACVRCQLRWTSAASTKCTTVTWS